jgi:signal peptidase II
VSNGRSLSERRVIGVLVIFFIAFLDQVSKGIVCHFVSIGSSIKIFENIDIVHVINKGISFGLLNDSNVWVLTAVYIVVAVICLFLFFEYWLSPGLFQAITYSLILGGAIGNIADRLFRGAVVDFIDFHVSSLSIPFCASIRNWHWPAFNIADSAVVFGVFLLCVHAITCRQHRKKNEKKQKKIRARLD